MSVQVPDHTFQPYPAGSSNRRCQLCGRFFTAICHIDAPNYQAAKEQQRPKREKRK